MQSLRHRAGRIGTRARVSAFRSAGFDAGIHPGVTHQSRRNAENEGGHDAIERRGRPTFGDRDAVRVAMEALLRLEGVQAQSCWSEGGSGGVHWLEAGNGPPLILLQGAGGGAANWYRLIGPLARRHRVLAPDLPGFGLSAGIEPVFPLGEQAARLMHDWLDRTGVEDPVDLLGTSFGGLVALRMTLARPDRVRRLVLLNACGLGRGVALPVRIAALAPFRSAIRHPSRAGTALLFRTLLTARRDGIPADQQAAIIDYTWRAACADTGDTLARALGMFTGLSGQREILGDVLLAGIRQPCLMLWGGSDRFLPCAHASRIGRLLPDARVRVLAGIGHSPNWEAPAAVLDAVLPFLTAPP
jgi:pimeloyl-ACP methyl ester carboxylesterase